jgi:hypothetical protein
MSARWQRNAPPVKDLMKIKGVDKRTAILCRKVIHGTLAPQIASPACAAWVRQCYWEPDNIAQIMEALNELTNGFGVEVIFRKGGSVTQPSLEYINQGYTYDATILRDPKTERIWVGCYGDVVEKWTSKYDGSGGMR